MTHAVKFHPGLMLLEQYVEGSLSADVALAVSAHIDLCPHCQQLSRDITNDQACVLTEQQVTARDDVQEWNQMLDFITNQPVLAAKVPAHDNIAAQVANVTVNGRTFQIPRALARLAENQNKWLHLGGIATAKLPTADKQHVSLLYIDKGTEVPNHTHLGLEMTLVLAGKIVDENGEYGVGDLLINSPDDTHTPRTLADEDCLCLSVLSAPLKFNKGLTRLLNPLQQFFY
ncbi:MAG: anti-sigma factor [Rheinheimera sp.]|uniref:ChrR family anti-sigma-E factor n=1 Tax=Arsukibacterium sp. UBA3155 TaxID=1946058 RepID=UPI000C98119B|nr:ChrR family anti-sigma-E factor [Arsukibacterium sp. UBA3155]MAD74745.1 anti-sigma factor [Rheinheimera sp.]|tara:strand:+ start:28235 stop:28924 length:690 start_codon:yes stop_codon:yes gene_type:complete